MPLFQNTVCDILNHKASHIYRVFRRGIRRCVGQIQILQFRGFHSCPDSGGQHINALIHTFIAYDLRTQQAISRLFKDHLHCHDFPAGVVTCMAHGRQDNRINIQPCFSGVGLIYAGSSGSHAKDLDDTAALGAGIMAVSATDVVRSDSSLFIGRASQRDQSILPGDEVLHLHRIAHGIDVGNRGFHSVIDHNTAFNAQFQPGILCKGGFGRNTNGQDYHIRMERLFVFQQHIHAAVPFLKPFYGMTKCQLYTVLAHFIMDERSHIGIKGIHKLFWTLDNGDIHPQLSQVFCQLQSNEATTCQYSGFGMVCIDVILDAEGIFNSAQGKQLIKTYTGKPGLGRLGSGRENQLVIALLELLTGFQIFHGNFFFFGMDSRDLMAHLHVYMEPGEEAFRGLEGQIRPIGNHITDIVWQTTVGIGDIPRALKNYDFCLLIQSANTGGSGSTACHTAYNDNFHIIVPPFLHKRKFRLCFSRWYNPSASK